MKPKPNQPFELDGIWYAARGSRGDTHRMGLYQVKDTVPRYEPFEFTKTGYLAVDPCFECAARWPTPLAYSDLDNQGS